jgi:hypothetical protein
MQAKGKTVARPMLTHPSPKPSTQTNNSTVAGSVITAPAPTKETFIIPSSDEEDKGARY